LRFLSFSPLTVLLAKGLIPFHRDKVHNSQLVLQGCQFSSRLQKADGIRLTQHGRANGRSGESGPQAQSLKQPRQAGLRQRTSPFREQERVLCLWHHRFPGGREASLIQIGIQRMLSVCR
jgi:hypothetical protein